jgi:hypothetical protein
VRVCKKSLIGWFQIGNFYTDNLTFTGSRKTRFFGNRVQLSTCNVFWLILPVVTCLSQRLSHACLSTHSSKVKPRMAH